MHSTTLCAAAFLLAGLRVANAQTFTECNPTEKSCPSDAALGTTLTTDFTKGASSDWTLADGTTLSYGTDGAEFTIKTSTGAPTIASEKYIFGGKVDAVMKASPGTGIVSSFILESDDLDEIDWEWLGSTDTSVESNFFGKGNTTTYDRAIYHNVAAPIETSHKYTIDWVVSEYVKWSIDDTLVRTLNYGDALALGGKNFPQTPMKIKMGSWVGCADEAANQPSSSTYGTCQWAGGPADFSKAPFTMSVQTVTIQDYSCGSTYSYGDMTGSYESIVVSGSCDGKAVSSSAGSSVVSSVTSSIKSSSAGGVFAQTSSGSVSSSSTAVTSSATGTSSANSSAGTTMSTATGSAGKTTATSATATATTSSSTSTTSSSPSTVSASAASTLTPKASKYGAIDVAVIALGLTLGYLIM